MSKRRVFLSVRTLFLLCIVLSVGIVGTLSSQCLAIFVAGLFLLALAILADRFSLPVAESFSAAVTIPVYLELGEEHSFVVTGRIAEGNVPTIIQLVLSDHMVSSAPSSRCSFVAGAIEAIVPVRTVRLGFASVLAVSMWVPSTLGLWLLAQDVEVKNASFRILPKKKNMPADRFRETISCQLAALQGDRRLMKSASPDLYHSSRPYRYPDPLRYMDRKKSAKYGSMYTKSFDSIHEHHLVIVIDLGRALCGSVAGSAKHDFYLSGALALAEHALRANDSVSIIAFSEGLHLVKQRCRSRDVLSDLYRGDLSTRPLEVASDYELMLKTVQRVASQRSIIVVLTDAALASIQSQLLISLPQLATKHLCVALTMLENRYDLTAQIGKISSDKMTEEEHLGLLYCYSVNDQHRQFSRKLGHLGASAVSVPEEYWLSATVQVFDSLRYSLNM